MAEKQKQIMTYQVERRNVSTRDWNYKQRKSGIRKIFVLGELSENW